MKEFKKEWITFGVNNDAIDWAEDLAKEKLKEVTTSQLRNFFDNLKKIQSEDADTQTKLNRLALLRPKLAYAVGKSSTGKAGFTVFYDAVCKCLSDVEKKEHINHFVDLMEAILAFHKMHGKK